MILQKTKLPKKYVRNEKEYFLDPIRKKLVHITPEETVRQKVLLYLIKELDVPEDMIKVEVRLDKYNINSNLRADIVIEIFDEDGEKIPMAVIECKSPDVFIDEYAMKQVMEYSNLLNCLYTVITDGESEFCFVYDDETDSEIPIDKLPEYENMLDGEYVPKEISEPEQRISFEEEQDYLAEYIYSFESYNDEHLSNAMPLELALPIYNFQKCIYDDSVKMPSGDYGAFRLIEDYGIRYLSCRNPEGVFNGEDRSLLLEVNGNTEFYSIEMSTYVRTSTKSHNKTFTSINIAHDRENDAHHALMLVLEDNCKVSGDTVDFWHSGRINLGNHGGGKIAELKELVREKCPELIKRGRFYFGSLKNDRLFRMDDPEVIELIKNLITYSIIREEFREKKKEEFNILNKMK